jgi:opacity protein-like surface antigen
MVLFGLMSTSAYAQLKDNIEINVFGAGSFYTHKNFQLNFPQVTTPENGQFHLDHAVRMGVRVGVYTRGHWSEEIFYSYEPNKMHIINNTLGVSLNLPIQVHNYGITALYYLNEDETHKTRPFLSIGIGGTLYRPTTESLATAHDPLQGDVPSLKSSNQVAMNYGFGVKTRVNNWLGFRAEAKGFLGQVPSFGLPRTSPDPTIQAFPVTGAIHNGELSAGLVFYFFNRH